MWFAASMSAAAGCAAILLYFGRDWVWLLVGAVSAVLVLFRRDWAQQETAA